MTAEPTFAELITVPLSRLAHIIPPLLTTGLRPMIWGSPGIGKTESAPLFTPPTHDFLLYRCSEREPTDLLGFPVPDPASGVMRFLPPAEFRANNGRPKLVFFDEINHASADMLKALLRILTNPEDYLPEGSLVMAAGNRAQDKAGVATMPSAVLSRFTHIEVVPELDSWVRWAYAAGVPAPAIAYARFQPDVIINQAPIASGERAFPNPRAFTQAARVAPLLAPEDRTAVLVGRIGTTHGLQFSAFLQHLSELPPIDVILSAPQTAPVPTELPKIWAVVGAVVDHVITRHRKLGQANASDPSLVELFGNALAYAERMPQEFGAAIAFGIAAAVPVLTSTQPWIVFNQRHPKLFA